MKATIRLLFLGLSLAACDLELTGVPIERDPPRPEADGSMAEEDAGDRPDASLPADAGGDDASGGHELPTYRYDFDGGDGPLDASWQAEPGIAQVWGQRLCILPGGRAELPLEPGRYGYLRVDAPLLAGLELSALGPSGELFLMSWHGASAEAGPRATLSGHEVGAQTPYAVTRYELEPDYDHHQVRVRVGETASAELAALGAGESLRALVFRSQATSGVVCVDNVYAAAARPVQDPFATALPVNACLPVTGDAAARCISEHCCADSIIWHRDVCGGTCPVDAELCAATCIEAHPSRSVADCTDLCRYSLFHTKSGGEALAACADDNCAGDPVAPVVRLEPAPDEPLPPASDHSKRLKVELEASAGSTAELVEIDLTTGERVTRASFEHLGNEEIELFTEPSHSRVFALDRSWSADINGRLLAWNAAAGESVMREVRLPAPVVRVVPSPTLRHVWVSTTPREGDLQHYLLRDGAVLFQGTGFGSEVGFGPDDRYAFTSTGYSATVIDLVAGRVAQFAYSSTEWGFADMLFEDSIAWLTCANGTPSAWVWRDLQGRSVPGTPPPLPRECTHHEGFMPGAPDLYRAGDTAPVRVGALPADFEADSWNPLFAVGSRALYFHERDVSFEPWYSLLMVDASGSIVARLDPLRSTVADSDRIVFVSRVVSFDGDHGLFVATRETSAGNLISFEAYRYESSAFAMRSLARVPAFSVDDLRISVRPDSPIVVAEGPDGMLGVFDMVEPTVLPYAPNERLPLSVWAQYGGGKLYR